MELALADASRRRVQRVLRAWAAKIPGDSAPLGGDGPDPLQAAVSHGVNSRGIQGQRCQVLTPLT